MLIMIPLRIVVNLLNVFVPNKEKSARANNSPFINKILSKAVMIRSRFRNRFLRSPSQKNNSIKKNNVITALGCLGRKRNLTIII